MELSSDNNIMLMVKSGEIDRLGLLFERYKKPLFGYFYRTFHDKETSEDLVQNVFIRILKYRSKFTGYGKFSSWMYRIGIMSQSIITEKIRIISNLNESLIRI